MLNLQKLDFISDSHIVMTNYISKHYLNHFSDVDDGFKNTKMIFEELGLKHTTEEDCRIVQHVCCLVSTRAAYLASAGRFIICVFIHK